MPRLLLKSEFLSDSQQVLITGEENTYKDEVSSQLGYYPNLKTHFLNNIDVSELSKLTPSVIIHFVGFCPPSYTSTFFATVYLHAILQLAVTSKARFILVISNSSLTVCKTAVTLTTQFSTNFKVRFDTFEINSEIEPQLAAQSLIRTFIYHHSIKAEKIPAPRSKIKPWIGVEKKTQSASKKFNLFRSALTVLALAAGLYVWFFFQLAVGLFFANCAAKSFVKDNLLAASNYSLPAHIFFLGVDVQSRILPGTSDALKLLGLPSNETDRVILSLGNTSRTIIEFESEITKSISHPNSSISSDPTQFISVLPSKYFQITESLDVLESDLGVFYQKSSRQIPLTLSLAEKINFLRSYLDKIGLITPQLPKLLGLGDRVTYLILIQDNSDLFSTGGIINSAILLTVKNSQVTDFKIYDASVVDSLLPGKIETPADLRRLTGQQYWSFNESNWDADFPATAAQSSWFITRALSAKPDVIIGVTPLVLKEIIKSTGPLVLDSSKSELNFDNFDVKYVNSLANNQFSSFRRQIISAFSNKISRLSRDGLNNFFVSVLGLLEKRQILVYPLSFPPGGFNKAGWTGTVELPVCHTSQSCFQAYLYPVNTNLKKDHSSLWVSQKNNLDIRLSQSEVYFRLVSSLVNPSASSPFHSNTSHIYKKIYLPAGSKIISAKINGNQVTPDIITPASSSGFLQLGFQVETPVDSKSVFELEYSKELSFTANRFDFQIDIPSQPGAESSSFDINVGYPPTWLATAHGNPLVASPGSLRYNTPNLQNTLVDINFFLR